MALTDGESGGIPATMLVSPTGNTAPAVNNGFGGQDGWWIILLILLIAMGGWGNNGNNNNGYGTQPIIVNDGASGNAVQRGFDQAAIMSGIGSIQNGVTGISTQLCNVGSDIQQSLCGGFAGVNSTVNTGFANAEVAANSRQMANMNQAFAAQTAMTQGFNQIGAQFADCCCENRLGIADLKYTVATENCADRAALSDGLRDVLTANTANTQAVLNTINTGIQSIKDQLCQDKIDEKNDTIAQLRQEVLFSRGQASQDVQTAELRANNATVANQLLSEMRSCPIPSQPVYGNQPIFTCNGQCNACGGCGCAA